MDVAVVATDCEEDVDVWVDVVASGLGGTVAVGCGCGCDREKRISAVRCRLEDGSESREARDEPEGLRSCFVNGCRA
jgi:hypothetical protein